MAAAQGTWLNSLLKVRGWPGGCDLLAGPARSMSGALRFSTEPQPKVTDILLTIPCSILRIEIEIQEEEINRISVIPKK
jgi:hypothetical protein